MQDTHFVAQAGFVNVDFEWTTEIFVASIDHYGKDHYIPDTIDGVPYEIPWALVTVLYRGNADECLEYFDDVRD